MTKLKEGVERDGGTVWGMILAEGSRGRATRAEEIAM
jgi:hypothetical protein